MQAFTNFAHKLNPLSQEAIHDIESVLSTKKIAKKAYLLRENLPCKNLYFIETGLLKMFSYSDGKEFIMNFFHEENMFTVLDSFPFQSPSKYNLIALEDTTVQYISYTKLETLSKKHHCIESFYRKLLLHATDNMMNRIREMLFQSHSEHYQHYLENHKELVQRLSLGDLACYLGITQVSLSRIRAKN